MSDADEGLRKAAEDVIAILMVDGSCECLNRLYDALKQAPQPTQGEQVITIGRLPTEKPNLERGSGKATMRDSGIVPQAAQPTGEEEDDE